MHYSASDSRSEGWVFEPSKRLTYNILLFSNNFITNWGRLREKHTFSRDLILDAQVPMAVILGYFFTLEDII